MKPEIILNFINEKRQIYEKHKITELQLELMIRVYMISLRGAVPTLGDVFRQTTYRYIPHLYRSADLLVEKGMLSLTAKVIKVKKRRYYHVTSTGYNIIKNFIN